MNSAISKITSIVAYLNFSLDNNNGTLVGVDGTNGRIIVTFSESGLSRVRAIQAMLVFFSNGCLRGGKHYKNALKQPSWHKTWI